MRAHGSEPIVVRRRLAPVGQGRRVLRGAISRPCIAPGDVSIHHCLTLHGSGPNRSGRPRRTIILPMFDSDCRLDAARLPKGAEHYFPTDGDGALATSAS